MLMPGPRHSGLIGLGWSPGSGIFYKLPGDSAAQTGMRACVLNLWIRGLTASSANPHLVGTAAQALLKSRLLRVGPHGGKQWNKEALSPAPHPRAEPEYLGRT